MFQEGKPEVLDQYAIGVSATEAWGDVTQDDPKQLLDSTDSEFGDGFTGKTSLSPEEQLICMPPIVGLYGPGIFHFLFSSYLSFLVLV